MELQSTIYMYYGKVDVERIPARHHSLERPKSENFGIDRP